MIRPLAILALLGSASMPALAHAAGQDAQTAAPSATSAVPGEIIVTAQRREQSILKVPVAVTAITGASLATKGITNSAELSQAVPNMQVNSAYGETQPNFSLRGVSVANEYNSNQVSPIGVYMDDVYLVSRDSQGMGLFDLDRIEVLRGPQGTLFGRNTTGGAINFITKQPSLNGTNGYVQAGYGNFNTFTLQAAGETTFAQDQVGVRAAVNYGTGDGQFKNVYPGGKDPDSTDYLQGRLSVRLRPTDIPLDVQLIAYGGRSDPTQAPVFGLQSARQGLNFFTVDENRIGRFDVSSYGGIANISYTLSPNLKLISITNYGGASQLLGQAADGAPIDSLDINWRSSFHQFSEEARINYNSGPLNLIAGLYYGSDTTTTNNTFYIGTPPEPAGVNVGFFQHFTQDRQSYAIFTQGDYNITSKLVLTLGFRYTEDRAQYKDGHADLFFGNVEGPQTPLATTVPCNTQPGTCAYNPTARYNLNGSSDAPTGRAALSYTFDNGTLAYISYNRGYRSGAFNGGSYTNSAGINYVQPETVNAYEAGFKGRYFDRRLTLAVAGYYYDYANQQLQDLRAGPVGILVNAPKSESYGAEAEATFRVTSSLMLNGSLGLLNATYQTLTLQGVNLSGDDLPFAPHVTLQAGFDWTMGQVFGGDVTFSPNLNYASHQYFSPFNTLNAANSGQNNAELQQGAYTKLNLSLTWKHGNVLVRAWANNVTDAEVLGYGLDLRGAGFPYNFLVPEAPRTFGVEVRYSF